MDSRIVKYGIDLGTTNSAIASMQNGEPRIHKDMDTQKDILPSAVRWDARGRLFVGEKAHNGLRSDANQALLGRNEVTSTTFIEFKRTMGTDKKYFVPSTAKTLMSEDLSAEVLKALRGQTGQEDCNAAVITVPAMFTLNQNEATKRAASIAGMSYCELLQEPIAASMAYGFDSKIQDSQWVVFDFGGGTFDAAIVRARDGIMSIVDTDGDNYLGGRDIDQAMTENMLIPALLREHDIQQFIANDRNRINLHVALKKYVENAKIELSYKAKSSIIISLGDLTLQLSDGKKMDIDIEYDITEEMFRPIVMPIYQRAIDKMTALLKRNNLVAADLGAILLVGGPTHSPILRRMIADQMGRSADTSVDPMTAVARGAAIYAAGLMVPEQYRTERPAGDAVQLNIGYDPYTVDEEVMITVKCQPEAGRDVQVSFARADKGWSSGWQPVAVKGSVVDLLLEPGKANLFNVLCRDNQNNAVKCDPAAITIIHGIIPSTAVLAYNLGVEIYDEDHDQRVFKTIPGLEKNASIPARGTIRGLLTQQTLRPGNRSDKLYIPLYSGGVHAENYPADACELLHELEITGADVPRIIPEGTLVDVSVEMTDVGNILVSMRFGDYDIARQVQNRDHRQVEVDAIALQERLNGTLHALHMLRGESSVDQATVARVETRILELRALLETSRADYDAKKKILDGWKEEQRQLHALQRERSWPVLLEELKDLLDDVRLAQQEFGTEETKKALVGLEEKAQRLQREQRKKLLRKLIEELRYFHFQMVDKGAGVMMEISLIRGMDDEFDTWEWSNRAKARQLIDQAKRIIFGGSATKSDLRPIVIELYSLLPNVTSDEDVMNKSRLRNG